MTSENRVGSPLRNELELFEKYCQIASLPDRMYSRGVWSAKYPEINIQKELFHASRTRDDRNVLVTVNETILKQIFRTYFEEGLVAALKQAVKLENRSRHPWIGQGAQYALRVIDAGRKVKVFFRPHLKIQGVDCVSTFSQTRDWVRSPIRCTRWHPNCFKVAVAANDDSIRLYSDVQHAVPILKNGLQKGITCMAWRPWNSSELAVGTQSGTLIWTIETFLQNASVKSQVVQLKHDSHFPVTSVEWNSSGTILATASISEPDVLLWDIDQNRFTPIRRVGPPSAQLCWAPDSSALCISTVGKSFRIFKSQSWQLHRWDLKDGSVQAMAWTPCKEFLLFCTTGDNFLYSLPTRAGYLQETEAWGCMDAIPIADLSKTILNGVDEIGGPVQSIAIDRLGNLLAVSFKETNAIAIFKINKIKRSQSLLSVMPYNLIKGLGDEYPSTIDFGSPKESVLMVGWSSGRVQYFPFVNNP